MQKDWNNDSHPLNRNATLRKLWMDDTLISETETKLFVSYDKIVRKREDFGLNPKTKKRVICYLLMQTTEDRIII